MAVISSIIAGVTAAVSAIGSALSAAGAAIATAWGAVGGFLGTSLGTIGGATITSGAAAGTVVGGTTITVGGVLAGVGMASMAALSLGTMYSSARASAKAQMAQANAIQQLTEETGKLEVNNTAKTIQENSRFKRTLSSLRVPLGITPRQNTDEVTQNVYGVDTNTVATATQNMMGLNIATA